MEKTQDKIGKTFTQGERDAIHMAVLPVVAEIDLEAGQNIGFSKGKAVLKNPIGIVDPFIQGTIKKGEMFFMFLYPNTITSLKHNWTHSGIPDVGEDIAYSKEESETWLRNFIESADCPEYDVVIAAASGEDITKIEGYEDWGGGTYNNDGEYLFFSGRNAHGDIPPEFWHHIEVVTGKKISESKKAPYFSCSC